MTPERIKEIQAEPNRVQFHIMHMDDGTKTLCLYDIDYAGRQVCPTEYLYGASEDPDFLISTHED